MKDVVLVKNFKMKFGNKTVIEDLSFNVKKGEIFGLLGANGSGKTTTVRALLGFYKASGGELLIDGEVYDSEDTDVAVGYLPEERGLYKKQKVSEMLHYLGSLKGMTKDDCERQIDHWLNRFGLSEWKDKKIEALSKGMSQKIQFISAVMHSPKILFLDEPFSGLDPVSSDQLLAVIKEMKEQGRIILFSTHVMETAEIICDHIIMLNHGKKILDGTIHEIRREFGSDTLTLDITGDHHFMKDIPAIVDVSERGNSLNIAFQKGSDINALIVEIVNKAFQNGCAISSLKVDEPSLHSIFVSIAGNNESEPQKN